jgi:hypothetical protein
MSDETRAVLTTICIMATLILWVPCLTLLTRDWKRYKKVSSPASGQSREPLASANRTVESCARSSDDEGFKEPLYPDLQRPSMGALCSGRPG